MKLCVYVHTAVAAKCTTAFSKLRHLGGLAGPRPGVPQLLYPQVPLILAAVLCQADLLHLLQYHVEINTPCFLT